MWRDTEFRRGKDCVESKEALCNTRTVGEQKSRLPWLQVTSIIFMKMIEVRCCSFGSVRSVALRLINSSTKLICYLMRTQMR